MPRQTDWFDTSVGLGVATGAQGLQTLMAAVEPIAMRGLTVIRTIVTLGLFSTTVAGAWGVQRASIGIGVGSQDAFTAGVVPDPNTPVDKPPRGWLYKTTRMVEQNGSGAPVVMTVEADLRGARKVEHGILYLVVDNETVVGTTFTLQVHGLVRCLFKL